MKKIALAIGLLAAPLPAMADSYDAVPGIADRGTRTPGAVFDIRPAAQIVAEASRYIGTRNPMGFRGPGCKAFATSANRLVETMLSLSVESILPSRDWEPFQCN